MESSLKVSLLWDRNIYFEYSECYFSLCKATFVRIIKSCSENLIEKARFRKKKKK